MNDAINRLSRMSVGNGTFKTEMKEILQNKYVMYAILIIAILNIVGYLALRNMDAILFFILVFLLSIYFTRNMIIVLFVSIVATNFYAGMTGVSGMANREGLKNSKEGNKNKNKEPAEGDEDVGVDADVDQAIEGNTGMKNSEDTEDTETYSSRNSDSTPDSATNDVADKNKNMNTGAGGSKKEKPKSGMQNLKPAKFKPSKNNADDNNVEEDDDDDDDDDSGHAKITGSKGNRVDYAETLSQAYNNLQNIIGKDGVKGLTNQTKDLMEQQKVLMNNMKDMEPIIKSAQGFMSQIMGSGGLDGISKLFDGKLFGAVAPAVAENAKSLDTKK